ncbi:MAG: hypothetical protein ABIF87_12680, partial [Pseudomonadota bacterium]
VQSPPMRGRGLKPADVRAAIQGMSPPMRGRGLKLRQDTIYFRLISVAPHAGAWIETSNRQ